MTRVCTFSGLNEAQREAATAATDAPLLVIAGAGSGKTMTLAHRLAHLVLGGTDPARILLLTFSRRAAIEMTRRAQSILSANGRAADIAWSGTFHAVANRLLRFHSFDVGLDPAFTVMDRADSCDLIDLVRQERGLAERSKRFPKKATCQSIYSRVVNSGETVEHALAESFPWCQEWAAELKELFRDYVVSKQAKNVLDYDDLLLFWFHLMGDNAIAAEVRERFDHVLVDEYQDTNTLQAGILAGLCPDGKALTVVGDDAQAIYSFRAATVKNILSFPSQFPTPARVVTLEENYRSTQPILDAANAVIEQAKERFTKNLFSRKESPSRPWLVTAEDETAEVDYIVERILHNRESGMDLKRQAVLFRTSHHSDALELELGRRNIPYVKFGGLKFLEAAHVKDVLCVLRWAENPRDQLAGFRILKLLPGIGPSAARKALDTLGPGATSFAALREYKPPAAARESFASLCNLLDGLADPATAWAAQMGAVRRFYEPLLPELYDAAQVRLGDIEQLEAIAGDYGSRERFLTELVLDPPEASGDRSGPPLLDEDYLILSTIHSAKGQEWDAVYLMHAADGCIPSDLATGHAEQIEEERRLLYVAMTRARSELHIVHPLRMFIRQQHRHGDRHVYTPLTRFIPGELSPLFERVSRSRRSRLPNLDDGTPSPARTPIDVGARLRDMWS